MRGETVSRDEILAAIRECAQKLKHSPSYRELNQTVPVSQRNIKKHFGSYTKAVRACGMEHTQGKQPVRLETLFREWAGVARKLGKIPTITEYEAHSRHSLRPLATRFKGWRRVPQGMLAYVESEGLEGEWGDVLGMVKAHCAEVIAPEISPKTAFDATWRGKLLADRPTYGPPMMNAGLAYGPANEMGVVYLFGMVSWLLGFVVMRLQSEFPDCEAMRKVDDQRWQKVQIEFEYESRNFLRHFHPVEGCDLIVCWIDNWPECPLEVIELSKVMPCLGCGNRA